MIVFKICKGNTLGFFTMAQAQLNTAQSMPRKTVHNSYIVPYWPYSALSWAFIISLRSRMVYRLPVRQWLLWHQVWFGHSTNRPILCLNKYSCTASKMEFINLHSTPEGHEGLFNKCSGFGMKLTCSKWTEFTT